MSPAIANAPGGAGAATAGAVPSDQPLDLAAGGAEAAVRRLARAPLGRSGRDYLLRRILVAADVIAMLVGVTFLALTPSRPAGSQHALWALPVIPAWLLLFMAYSLYSPGMRRVGHSTVDDLPGLFHVFLLGGVGMWLYFKITPPGALAPGRLGLFIAVVFSADFTLRSFTRRLSLLAFGSERVVVVGSGPMAQVLVRQVLRQSAHGLHLVGSITRTENAEWPLPITTLGALQEIDSVDVLLEHRVERVIVSGEGISEEALLGLVGDCRRMGIMVSALPSLAAMIGPAATIDQLEGITMIGLTVPTLARSSQALKRAMDIGGALVLLIVTAPVSLAAAIAIKLDSPGPIMFRQQRIGRGGAPFPLTKFRTMVVDAEARRAELLQQSRQASWLDLEHDPRITRVGRFLRLTSIDELPELWDVLRGHMSLVGPRPLIEQEDRNVSGWARDRLDLTPGLTGMWQVLGRTSIPFEQMVMIDYVYVANWSLWMDVKLMLRTLPAVLRRDGAN
ncbi:MAG: sugar transferase [Actinobacteria bacterium]|nr:sugar transferase [Actinomycetota bacterium]